MPDISELVGGTFPTPTGQDQILRGTIAVAPINERDELQVTAMAFSGAETFEVRAGRWIPRGGTMPAVGAACLLILDETGEPYVPVWAGESSGVGGGGHDTAPIGAVMAWSRRSIPDDWVLANGQPLSGDVYADAYVMAQAEVAAGNPLWTVNAGAHTFTVPNLQDKFLWSADPSRSGETGGEYNVALDPTQMPAHAHTGKSGWANELMDHQHALVTSEVDLNHLHDAFTGNYVYDNAGSLWTWAGSGVVPLYHHGTTNWPDRSLNHLHTGVTDPGQGSRHDHTHSFTSDNTGGGLGHNNMPPFLVLGFLIKVLGVTVSAGGVLQGPTGATGPVGPASTVPGPAGPAGPPGAPGSGGDLTYTHTQNTAAMTWTVTHNLGKFPSVMVVDMADQVLIPDVLYLDAASVRLTFGNPVSGKAFVN